MTDADADALAERVRVLELVAVMFVTDLKKRLPPEDRARVAALLQGLGLSVSSPEATRLLSDLSARLE